MGAGSDNMTQQTYVFKMHEYLSESLLINLLPLNNVIVNFEILYSANQEPRMKFDPKKTPVRIKVK